MIPKIVCFGETLWDIFPDKKVIGGAPLNVSLRLHALGADSKMISRIGQDNEGVKLLEYLKSKSFDISLIQTDKHLNTGNVQVHLDQNNTATYTISEPVAWDHISIEKADIEQISKTDAFIFGSLCCRNSISRKALFECLPRAKFKVFDANLRAPFYTMELIVQLIGVADMIKLNDEELEEVSIFMKIKADTIDAQIKELAERTNTKYVCVTLGADGAIYYENGMFFKNPGYKVIVKDTVGAGDSFLASFVYQFILGTASQAALDFSCAMGSLVASKNGGNAHVFMQEIENIQNPSN